MREPGWSQDAEGTADHLASPRACRCHARWLRLALGDLATGCLATWLLNTDPITHTCTVTHEHVCTCLHTHTHAYTWAYTYTHMSQLHAQICTCTQVYLHIYSVGTHTHTHTHTATPPSQEGSSPPDLSPHRALPSSFPQSPVPPALPQAPISKKSFLTASMLTAHCWGPMTSSFFPNLLRRHFRQPQQK